MDCGPTCIRMVAKHYGKAVNMETLRHAAQLSKDGVSLLGIAEAAEIKKETGYFMKNFKKANMAANCVAQNTKAQSISLLSVLAISSLVAKFRVSSSRRYLKSLFISSRSTEISLERMACLLSKVFSTSSLIRLTNSSASFSPNLAFNRLYKRMSDILSVSATPQIYTFQAK
jgi:Peptidase C39 family